MFICKDNHLLVSSTEAQQFQTWFNNKISNDANDEIKTKIIQAVADIVIKFTNKIEEQDQGFYVLKVVDLTNHIDKVLNNEESKIKLKVQLDIREYMDEVNDINIVIHKNKMFNGINIDPDENFLLFILIATSSYADTIWKANKAVWKNSKCIIDSKVRQCYMNYAEQLEEIIELPETEELTVEQYLDILPETSTVGLEAVNSAKQRIQDSTELLKQLKEN